MIIGLLACLSHGEQESGAEIRTLSQITTLDEQGVGAFGIGGRGGIGGFEEAAGEVVIDGGEAVLAVRVEQPLGLGAGDLLGLGKSAVGQCHGGQFGSKLDSPGALRDEIETSLKGLAGQVEILVEPQGDSANEVIVRPVVSAGVGVIGEPRELRDRLVESPLLHGDDDLGRQLRGHWRDRLLRPRDAAGRLIGGPRLEPEQPDQQSRQCREASALPVHLRCLPLDDPGAGFASTPAPRETDSPCPTHFVGRT